MHNTLEKQYDVVVIGGGMAGLCAALAAARAGAHTALVHNRPVLGGNASSEIRMHICGASVHGKRKNARETGILEELLLENKRCNPQHSFSIWDTILWGKAHFQEGLELYLNTQALGLSMEAGRITRVNAYQMTTEKTFLFSGPVFVDCTGDGLLAAWAGADSRMGREAKSEYSETFAPDAADSYTMGSALMFSASDMGRPCAFEKPTWAYDITEKQLEGRQHTAEGEELSGVDSGYWWMELGGTQDVLRDGEEIRDELLKTLYGVWDHIKNKPGHGAENYALDWVQFLPGKRESRRILGDHVLCQQELACPMQFEDTVAYGGWPMDMHPPEGFLNQGVATEYLHLERVYPIPYRCYYSRNVENLMVAGRAISATHTAFGSTRTMGTCAVGGQAVGTAAAMAARLGCTPRGIGAHMEELQQRLLRDDCYLPGVKNKDPSDLARLAAVRASSHLPGWEPENVISGVSRPEGETSNAWRSRPLAEGEALLRLEFAEVTVGEVQFTFDSDLSAEIMITLSKPRQHAQCNGLPATLVKTYAWELYRGGQMVYGQTVAENGQRLCRHLLPEGVRADMLTLRVLDTHGCAEAAVCEVRIYEGGSARVSV